MTSVIATKPQQKKVRKPASFEEATLNSTTFSEQSIRDIIGQSSKGKSILRY